MGYERYPRNSNFQNDAYSRQSREDYGRDYGSERDDAYAGPRDYAAAGSSREQDRDGYGGRPIRSRDDADARYGQRDRYQSQRSGGDTEYRGSYASDGHRFENVGRYRHADDDTGRGRQDVQGRRLQGDDQDDRGFFARAGDEVRSWFGDDEAERRREADSRYDGRDDGRGFEGSHHRDEHYHGWRRKQIAALDRDYDEYRNEHRTRFDNEFSSWRTQRQTQRTSLEQVQEHMDVVGSDGDHVGTVDKVRDDRILLTKNDKDAGGHHHSIPSNWIQTVDTRVTLSKTAAEAKQAWKDEDRNQAMFGYGDRTGKDKAGDTASGDGDVTKGRTLGKSFSGTY